MPSNRRILTEYLPGQNESGDYKHTFELANGKTYSAWSNESTVTHPEDRTGPISSDPYNDIRKHLPEGWTLDVRSNSLMEITDKTGMVLPVALQSVGQGLGRGQQVWQDESSYMQQSIIKRIGKEGNPYYEFRSSAEQFVSYAVQSHERMAKDKTDNWLEEYRHVKAKGDFSGGLGVVPAIPIPSGMYETVNADQALTVRLLSETSSGTYGTDRFSTNEILSYLSRHIAYSAGGIGNPLTRDRLGMEVPNPNYIAFQSLRLGGYGFNKEGDALTPRNYYWRGFDETGASQAYVPLSKKGRNMITAGIQPEYGTIQGTGNFQEFVPFQPGPLGSNSPLQTLGTVPEGFRQPPPGRVGNWAFAPGILNAGGILEMKTSKPKNNLIAGFTTSNTTDLTIEDLRDLTKPGIFDLGNINGRVIRANQRNTTVGTYNKPGVEGGIPIRAESPIRDFYLQKAVLTIPLRIDETGTKAVFGENKGISSEKLAETIRKNNPGLTVARENIPGVRFSLSGVETYIERVRGLGIKGQFMPNPVGFSTGGTEYQYITDEIKTSTLFPGTIWGSRSVEQRKGILSDWAKMVGTDVAQGVSDYYNNVLSKREGKDNIWDRLAGKYRQLSGNPEDRPGGLEFANRVWNTVFENVRENNPESMERNARNRKEYDLGWATNEKGGLGVSYPMVLSPDAYKMGQSDIDRGLRINHPDWTNEQIVAERDKTLINKGTFGTNIIAQLNVPSMFLAPNLIEPGQGDYNSRNLANITVATAMQNLSPTIANALGLGNIDSGLTTDSQRAQFGYTSWRMYQKGLDEGSTELPPGAITMDDNMSTTLSTYLEKHNDPNNLEDPERQGSSGWYAGVTERTGDPNSMLYYKKTNTLLPPLSAAMASAVPETMGESVGQSVNEWVKATQGVSAAEWASQYTENPEEARKMGHDAISNLLSYQDRVQRTREAASKSMQQVEIGLGRAGKGITINTFPEGSAHIFPNQVKDMLRGQGIKEEKMDEAVKEFYKNARTGAVLRDPQTTINSAFGVNMLNPKEAMAGMGNTPEERQANYEKAQRTIGNRVAFGPGIVTVTNADEDGDPFRIIINAELTAKKHVKQLTDPEFQSKILKTVEQVTQREMEITSNQYTAGLSNANVQSAVNVTKPGYRSTSKADPDKSGVMPLFDFLESKKEKVLNTQSNMPASFNFGLEADAAASALGLSKERRSRISNIRAMFYQPSVDLRGTGEEAVGFRTVKSLEGAKAGTSEAYGDYLSFGDKPGGKRTFLNLSHGAGLGTYGEIKWMKQMANVMSQQTTIEGKKVNLLNATALGDLWGSTDEEAASITSTLNKTDPSKWGETIGETLDVKDGNLNEAITNLRSKPAWMMYMDVMYRKSRETLPANATPEQRIKKANERRIMDEVREQTGAQEMVSGAGIASLYRRYFSGQNLFTPNEMRELINSTPEGIDKNHLTRQAKFLNIPLTPGGPGEPPNLPPTDSTLAGPDDEDPVRRKAIKAAGMLRASGVSDTVYYNPLKNVLKAMDTPMAPEEGQKYINRGEEVHTSLEKKLKEKYQKQGWGVDTESEFEGVIAGRKVTGKLDVDMIKPDPNRPGYHIGMIIDVKGKTGVNTAAGQLSIYAELKRQEGEKVGIKYSRIELAVQPYEGGEEGLKKDVETIAKESAQKEAVPVIPWSKKKLESRIEKVARDQESNIDAAVELTHIAQDNQRSVSQSEIKDRTTITSALSGRQLYQARHPGEVSAEDASGGGTGGSGGGGGGNRYGSYRPPSDKEAVTALIKAVGMLEKIAPFEEMALINAYEPIANMPAPPGQEGVNVYGLDPAQLTRYANQAGGAVSGSPQLAMIAKTAQAVKTVTNRGLSQARELARTTGDPLLTRYVGMVDTVNDPQTTQGKMLATGDELAYLTGSKMSSGGIASKKDVSYTAEEMGKLSENLEKVHKITQELNGSTVDRKKVLQEELKAVQDSNASVIRGGQIRAVETEISKLISQAATTGVAPASQVGSLETLRDKLVKQETDYQEGKPAGFKLGTIARRLTSGWGLMYMQNVLGAIAGGGDYGSQEAQAQYASTAGLATTMLGAPTIGATMAQRITAAKTRVGGISPRDTMGLYLAEHPGAESALETGKAGAFAFAGTEWAMGMLPAGTIAPGLTLPIAVGVGLASAAVNFGMQSAGQTEVSTGNWMYQNPQKGNTFAEKYASAVKNYYANPPAAIKYAWNVVTGDEKFIKEAEGIESLNKGVRAVLEGKESVDTMKILEGEFGRHPSEQQVVSIMGSQLAEKYKSDIESANKVATLIDLNNGQFDPTQATRLLAQTASGIDQAGGISTTFASRGMTQQEAMRQGLTMTLQAQTPLNAFQRAAVIAGEAFVQAQPSFWQPNVPKGTDEYNKFAMGYDLAPMRGDYLSSLIQGAGAMMNLGINVPMPTEKDVPQNVSQFELMQQQYKSATQQQYSQGILSGDARMWGQIANIPGINLQNMPGLKTTFGTTIGAEYAAFTGYNMAGQQTGGEWGRQSLQMGAVSSATMAQRIYAPTSNVMSNFSEYGKYGQAYINAQVNGVELDNGQLVGGAIGGQQWIMEQQYGFAQRGIAISRQQNALSAASLGISYQQLALNQAFQTGVGLGNYSGTINPQTGQPFGISTGNFSFNAPGGYNFASQGGGMWGIEDAQRNLGYAQTQFGFQMQQKQMNLQSTQFFENMGLQAQGMALNKAQGMYQYQYGTQMAERQFGFSQTMFEEGKRFLTGRERRLAERQNEFNVETYNLETDNREKQFGFQKQQWKLQEDQFKLQIKQFNETKQLQQEQLDANRKFFEISKQLQEEATKLTRASWVAQIELQKQSLGIQAKQIALNGESIDLQEDQMEFQRIINGLDLIANTNRENVIDAVNRLNTDTFPLLLKNIKENIPDAIKDMINKILIGMGADPIIWGGTGEENKQKDDKLNSYVPAFGKSSVTPAYSYSALTSSNNGPSPENNTIIKRSNNTRERNINNIQVYIGDRQITEFIVRTVEDELKNG